MHGSPVPLATRVRLGAELREGRYDGQGERAVLARGYAVTVRDLWNWEHLPQGKPGRRPRAPEVVEAAMAACRTVLAGLRYHVGWRKVHDAVRLPKALVQKCVKALKASHRAAVDHVRRLCRMGVRMLLGDALWSLDETHLGRLEDGDAVLGLVVREVASTRTLVISVGPAATERDLIRALEHLRAVRGELPLVVAMDNGPPMKGGLFAAYLTFHEVVALRNVAYVSQHNSWVERGHRDLKEVSGLGKGVVLCHAREAVEPLQDAVDHLDGTVPLTTRDMKTAVAVDRETPRWYASVDRSVFFRAVLEAVQKAVKGCRNDRERRKAEREAILCTMERFGLIQRTRGGAPISHA